MPKRPPRQPRGDQCWATQERFAAIGAEPVGSTPDQLAAHLKHETGRWSALIRERNIRAD